MLVYVHIDYIVRYVPLRAQSWEKLNNFVYVSFYRRLVSLVGKVPVCRTRFGIETKLDFYSGS